jgi:hypothetical protein
MSDEKRVPATLESIAQSVAEILGRFDGVDQRLDGIDRWLDGIDRRLDGVDTRLDELKAQLRTEIESVRDDVKLVAEAVAAQNARHDKNDADHKVFTERLDAYGDRILALERRNSA